MPRNNLPIDKVRRTRRRSIVEGRENESKLKIEKKTKLSYRTKYVENVKTEIEKWKMHITETLEKINKFKSENNLQNMAADRNILSSRYRDLIASFDCEEYVRRV
ncbi:uncharacterized protein LOC108910153 [Anoplophora glabripennis]|uniref:uncharacterized protein LOC108910153 n=1 Tax=Anoplophora glabripennis TaxID=217634 RepID=UPI0008756356|nr:uncharacterized protein LOC108910153 [Anoplophora glabripennis]